MLLSLNKDFEGERDTIIRCRYAHINLVDMQRENAVELSFQSLQQCVGAGSFNPFTFEFQKDVFSVGANNSLCYQLSMPVYVIARYSYADENRFCNNELSPGASLSWEQRCSLF